jgi:hypothetical protein
MSRTARETALFEPRLAISDFREILRVSEAPKPISYRVCFSVIVEIPSSFIQFLQIRLSHPRKGKMLRSTTNARMTNISTIYASAGLETRSFEYWIRDIQNAIISIIEIK